MKPIAAPMLAFLLLLCFLPITPLNALDPSDAALGISLYNQGRLGEAKEVLERVAEAGQAGAVELAVLGMTCTKLGEHQKAREILLKAKDKDPFSSVVHIGLGMLEFSLQDYQAAYECFELARRLEPDSLQAKNGMVASLVNRAIVLHREGASEQAEAKLLEARRIAPDAAVVLQNLSLIHQNRGNLDQAETYAEEALRLEPRNPVLIGMLIQLRREQDHTVGLAELYRRLIAVQPQNAQAYAELGELLVEQDLAREAEEAFLEAEYLGTEEPYPYIFLARLSRQREEQPERIITRLHSAIGKAVRKSGMIQMQAAGTIQGKEGQLGAQEIEALQELSELSEQPRQILLEALELLEQIHDNRDEYQRDLERLSSWYPHNLELRIALGQLLEQLDRYREARDHWLDILNDFSTVPAAHLGLARCLEHLGRTEEARIAFRRARDLDPENPEVYRALLRLCGSRKEEQELMSWYGEVYARERTNIALLDAWAEIEERLGLPEQAAGHRLRARALEQKQVED